METERQNRQKEGTWALHSPTPPHLLGKGRALSCGSVVGLGQEPRLLASLQGGPKPQSPGDGLFWGPGYVDFSSHPVHFRGLEQQGWKRSWPWAIFSKGSQPG